jgi:hypothetical protein
MLMDLITDGLNNFLLHIINHFVNHLIHLICQICLPPFLCYNQPHEALSEKMQ